VAGTKSKDIMKLGKKDTEIILTDVTEWVSNCSYRDKIDEMR